MGRWGIMVVCVFQPTHRLSLPFLFLLPFSCQFFSFFSTYFEIILPKFSVLLGAFLGARSSPSSNGRRVKCRKMSWGKPSWALWETSRINVIPTIVMGKEAKWLGITLWAQMKPVSECLLPLGVLLFPMSSSVSNTCCRHFLLIIYSVETEIAGHSFYRWLIKD